MKRFRVFLIPIGAVFELVILGLTWACALFSKRWSAQILDWALENLPDLDWYLGDR